MIEVVAHALEARWPQSRRHGRLGTPAEVVLTKESVLVAAVDVAADAGHASGRCRVPLSSSMCAGIFRMLTWFCIFVDCRRVSSRSAHWRAAASQRYDSFSIRCQHQACALQVSACNEQRDVALSS